MFDHAEVFKPGAGVRVNDLPGSVALGLRLLPHALLEHRPPCCRHPAGKGQIPDLGVADTDVMTGSDTFKLPIIKCRINQIEITHPGYHFGIGENALIDRIDRRLDLFGMARLSDPFDARALLLGEHVGEHQPKHGNADRGQPMNHSTQDGGQAVQGATVPDKE